MDSLEARCKGRRAPHLHVAVLPLATTSDCERVGASVEQSGDARIVTSQAGEHEGGEAVVGSLVRVGASLDENANHLQAVLPCPVLAKARPHEGGVPSPVSRIDVHAERKLDAHACGIAGARRFGKG